MTKSIAGAQVDTSYLQKISAEGLRVHGEKWDVSDLAATAAFAPYLHNGTRLKVRRGDWERTGTVGKTTGWKPAFLLMHRSNAHGSWDVLTPDDEIVAVWNGRRYESV